MNELRDTVDIGEITQYIIIRLGDEQYGIDIKFIDNIVRMQNITRVPKIDEYFKGVINIRGVIVPVMSIRILMGMDADDLTDKSRIIILKIGDEGELLGIIVDQVDQVLNIGSKNVDKLSLDDKSKKANGRFISGVGKYEGGLVSILDLASLEVDK
ncbi:chemotaxis protein CheW [Butyrivibrio sp. MC2013]|uniref:chemotaxis protein CheW n=1 Tax=Butyrivibrio sp. MC2013 TaxID=1280686 RepID=UPI00040BBFCD|nr:chemotaxis protein CheW [Butyrivibrio sp. MC2013]